MKNWLRKTWNRPLRCTFGCHTTSWSNYGIMLTQIRSEKVKWDYHIRYYCTHCEKEIAVLAFDDVPEKYRDDVLELVRGVILAERAEQ